MSSQATAVKDRLASETEEERAARLQQMSANQHHRLAAETGSEREARLQRNREGQRGQQSQLPLFEQLFVQAKMRKFHAEIAALEMQKCTTYSEGFLGLQLCSHSTECVCCKRDKHVPKLYSSTSYSTWFRPHHPPTFVRIVAANWCAFFPLKAAFHLCYHHFNMCKKCAEPIEMDCSTIPA